MLLGDKNPNLKDSTDTNISIKDTSLSVSYRKTQKLITALYMVTDIIDKEEPIRHKLRNLGAEIILDMHSVPAEAYNKITGTMSFLDIASAMNFISEMNCAILKKEFIELKKSIEEHAEIKPIWLEEFFETPSRPPLFSERFPPIKGQVNSKGHTRIGVQKGSTLMKAIKDMSNKIPSHYESANFRLESGKDSKLASTSRNHDFGIIKKQRREDIINSIKKNGGSATITDIKNKAQGHLVACGEKTLQRELVSMTTDGFLNKTGEKRWSRYQIRG